VIDTHLGGPVTQQPTRVDFVIVDDSRGHINSLVCPNKCGCMFDIDAYTNENLVFDAAWKGWVAKCPDCGAIQNAEDDEDA